MQLLLIKQKTNDKQKSLKRGLEFGNFVSS